MVLFVNYNNMIADQVSIAGVMVTRPWMVLLIWITILAAVMSHLIWGRIRSALLTRFLNITALILLVLPSLRFIQYNIELLHGSETIQEPILPKNFSGTQLHSETSPDIFYIILDGYAREDVLEKLYQYDNSQFVNDLQRKGFFVASLSRANYIQTLLSLSSSLNLQYLNEIRSKVDRNLYNENLQDLIRES
jgi:hypothetical protein